MTRIVALLMVVLFSGCGMFGLAESSRDDVSTEEICAEKPDHPRCLEPVDGGNSDSEAADAGTDAVAEAGVDATVDASSDARVDASMDATVDASSDASDAHADTGPSCMCAADGGKPVCVESTGQCVACTGWQHCGVQKPVCSSTQCMGCMGHSECSARADTPACNVATGACVKCTSDNAASCKDATPVCDPSTSNCVACNVNADCKDSAKPTCDNHVCRACQNDNDCSGKMSGGVALDACYSGSCVDCRVDATDTKKDYGCVGSVACNPATRTCSGATKNTIDVCFACVADSECIAGHRCVPLNFNGMSVGGYCMKVAGGGACSEPYLAAPLSKQSLSGAPTADYCGLTEASTSCEAVKALEASRQCPGGDAGACQAKGALCATVNLGANRCTYRCTISGECPTGAPCGGPQGSKVCGG